jgi:hypothetical protein
MVYNESESIHSLYNKNFRESATIPALKIYLQNKNNWIPETSNMIQWEWFRQAIRKYKAATPNHLTKLIYNQLATPARKAKAGGQHWHDPICPHCHLQPESFDHMLRCDDTNAIEYRMHLPTAIAKLCDKSNTPTKFKTILMVIIDQWLGQQIVKVPPKESNQIKQLITAQELIGWTNFTWGFYAKEWHDFLLSDTPPNTPTKGMPSTFFSNLIALMWTEQTAFWTAYQEWRHATPPDHTDDTEKITKLKEEITYLFSLRDQTLPAHLDTYFPQDLPTFLKHSTQSQLHAYIQN